MSFCAILTNWCVFLLPKRLKVMGYGFRLQKDCFATARTAGGQELKKQKHVAIL